VVSIHERPAEAEDRAVPGHWEGDLIRGTHASAIATLVERSSRLVLLVKVDAVDAGTVAAALRTQILTLPEQLRRSLTWDRARRWPATFSSPSTPAWPSTSATPRARGSAGATRTPNGLLRQYLPKRTDLRAHSQADLDAIAAELNGRPRKTLEFVTPSEKFTEAVALTP
jgi:IS30 family transposase